MDLSKDMHDWDNKLKEDERVSRTTRPRSPTLTPARD